MLINANHIMVVQYYLPPKIIGRMLKYWVWLSVAIKSVRLVSLL